VATVIHGAYDYLIVTSRGQTFAFVFIFGFVVAWAWRLMKPSNPSPIS
jgi:hypothetical protein